MDTAADIPPHTPAPKLGGVFVWVFLALVAAGNLLVLSVAWRDRAWGAFYAAIIGGPILNGVLLVVGLIAIPFLRRRRVQFSLGRHLALTLGVPIAAVVADFFIIYNVDGIARLLR